MATSKPIATKKSITVPLTAKEFIKRLEAKKSAEEAIKYLRYFKTGKGEYGEGDVFMGVRMGDVFKLAKEFVNLPLKEVEILLENKVHEVRTGAVSIMDFQARDKKTTEERRKELYDLYLRRHDRINNWDLVDRSAVYVVGSYLADKPHNILYKLARSKNIWERRTAIIASFYFIRTGDLSDCFKIAEVLIKDKEDLIHKAAGGVIREAGKKDPKKLLAFLDKHAATMSRTFLRYAIEKLDPKNRKHYMGMKELPKK